ncbi:A-kinase anchor protein 12 [Micropterus salmoides]|uniref:A-kinase anchor protein 12 n=1 Tax=Micropterus salmoides TaxID=27706 RepID=UPI0018ECF1C2|nr:A-kinase anchor protein 12 [Micropterus salmoides]
MGDAQSAQRGEKKDAAAEEESGKVDDAQEENIEEKPLKNTGQISEINGKADCSTAEVNGHCRDEIAAEAFLLSDGDVSETGKPLKEDERPLENVEISENNSPMEADTNEDVPLEIDAKQNDINESFRRFFSNIGLKLTVKRGSGETPTDEPDKSNQEEPNRPEDIEDATKETKHENAERNTDVNIAQETYDNDSATCHTLTDITSEDVLENAEEQTAETKEVESDNADAATTSPVGEDAQQDATPEEEPHSTSPSCPEDDVVISPIKRFFTTGIFSGLRKKKKRAEDETTEKEFVDMAEVVQMTEQTVQDQQHDKEEISQGVEAAAVETEHKDNELKKEILYAASAQTTDEEKSPTKDPSTIIINESEILSSQEKDKVHASPLKRLLSGSSLKKLSKMQRSRKSSDAKLSDSGEHVSDQLISSTESAENQKEGPAQPSVEAAGEEDSPWASFKKLVTPKKRMKRPSVSNEETQIPGSLEEPKPSEGEQISDHSTEEGKKRKDSSVSWEAVLCGSGRRRSRKTSDSEDETPQIDNNDNKKDGGSKHGAELLLESSYETDSDILASSPRQAGSSSEGDGGSTWKSLKRLVTPKRKAKDENESKDNEQSDSEVTHDESFSIKKLLPGRRKRKSAEKQDQVSSDEAEKDVASDDEDSDTPAVVPLSEFDTVETEVHIQIWADVESHLPEEADNELQQDLLDKMTEPVLPCDSLQTEAKQVQDNDALEKLASTTLVVKEEPDDLTESVSNHQQLSDIPEEGIITETMVTPASVTEEAARDDTLAEDLIEITSEAITAPEPASDITLADETEMISAVSQLSSESSKTSGNTTPVPAQYDAMETDVILHQVVETISISAKAVPVCSVSHQILETFEKEPTILEIHRRLDASAINTGLNVEEFDAINELTAQTESISEVNYSVSTEIVSEVHTEEFDTAEIAVDEVHFTDPEESTGESYDKEKCLSELNASVSTDTLPEGEEMVLDEGSLVDAHRAETEPAKIYSQETGSPATVSDETKDGAKEQEVLTLTEKEDQIMQNITGQIQLEDKDQPPLEAEELQELAAVQAATLDSEERSVQLLEKEVISEDIRAAKTITYEPKEETVPLNEVNIDPEKKDELETDAAKNNHVQEAEALACSVQSQEEEVNSEDIPTAKTVIDEPKQTAEHLPEVSAEPENKELPVNAVKTEHQNVQKPEILDAVQTPTLNSEDGSVQSLEKEVNSEDVPKAKTVTDELKEETIPLIEVNLEQVDASNTEHVHQALKAVQSTTLDLGAGSLLSIENEEMSEDILVVETVTDEPKQEIEVRFEPKEKAAKTENVQEPDVLPPDVKHIVPENKTEEGASMYVHGLTQSTVGGSTQELEKFVLLEDISKPEDDIVIESEVVAQLSQSLEITEDQSIPQDAEQEECIPEVVDMLQTLTAVQLSSVNEEASNVQVLEKTVISEETTVPCLDNAAVTDEHKHEVRLSVVQVSVEGEKESEYPSIEIPKRETELMIELEEKVVQELQILPSEVQDIVTETKTEEGASMYMHVVTESTEGGSAQELEKFVLLEDVPTPDADNVITSITDKTESEVVSQLDQPLEISGEQKTESIPQDVEQENCIPEDEDELQTLPAVNVSSINKDTSNVQVLEKTVISEETPAPSVDNAAVTDEHKHEVHLSVVQVSVEGEKGSELKSTDIPKQEIEARVEPEEKVPVEDAKTEHVQELQVLPSEVQDIVTETKTEEGASMYMHVVTESTEGGSAQELEKFVLLEDVPTPDADNVITSVTDETESEVVSQLDHPLEISREQKTESIPKDVEQKDCIPEDVDELQRITAVQLSCVNEEASNVQVLEKTVISEETAVPCLDNAVVIDEHKHEVRLSVVQVSVEGEKGSELKSIDIPKQEIEARVEPEEKVPVEDAKTEHVQELHVLPSEVQDIVTETKTEEGASMYMHVVTESTEGGSAQELEKFVLLEDVPTPDADNVITSVTDETESEVVSQLDHPLEISREQKTESIPKDVEQKDCIPEDVDELQRITAVQLSCVNEEASNVQVLEKTVISEETAVPCLDNAVVIDEHKHEVRLSVVQVSVEGEKGSELKSIDIPKQEIEARLSQKKTFRDIKGAENGEYPKDVEQKDCIPEDVDELQRYSSSVILRK